MQKTSPWNIGTFSNEYFFRQLKEPYQSTKHFFNFLNENNLIDSNKIIVDACCGSGGNSFYLADNYSPKKIIAFDYQDEYLKIAKSYQNNNFKSNTDIVFLNSDIYDLSVKIYEKIDGVIFLQTLSWLTDWKKSLLELKKLDSEWIAISSLFYDGLIEAEITIKKFRDNEEDPVLTPYNVYSIPMVEKYLKELGYSKFYWKKFEIDMEIEKPTDVDDMGTYTERTKSGNTLQLSGPIILPWYFLIAKK